MGEAQDWRAARDALEAIAKQRVETHAALVFLTDDRALKLRKPVNFGWLDYATRAQRETMARREAEWNAGAAPGLYLGVAWLARGPDGRIALGAPGEDPAGDPLEPVVVMRRFALEDLLDDRARRGALDPRLAEDLGRAAAALHRAAPIRARPPRARESAEEESAQLEGAPALDPEATAAYGAALRREGARLDARAASRLEAGAVRRCHGDLHLKNIVLWRGAPRPFDRIEFNDAFAEIDVQYDLAFLLMDLIHRGLAEQAGAAFNGWLEAMAAAPDALAEIAYGGLDLLPLHLSLRAAIRAKVGALTARSRPDAAEEARAYLALAAALLDPGGPPRLVALGGRSGTGKSALARALALRIAPAPGAAILRSDAIRKGLHGVTPQTRLPASAYAKGTSGPVYGAMRDRAALALRRGRSAILDAAHLRRSEQDAAQDLARAAGVGFLGVWLEAPDAVLAARLDAREGDVSDAAAPVMLRQARFLEAPEGWLRLDAARPVEELADAALARGFANPV